MLKVNVGKNKTIHGWFDGACEPYNPGGNMGLGAYALIAGVDGPIRIFEHSDYIPADGWNSNNVAEYLALKALLEFLINNNLDDREIFIKGDSNMVISQMNNQWRIKAGRYVKTARECREMVFKFQKRPRFFWIPREENTAADDLSKKLMVKNKCEFRIQPMVNPQQRMSF